jgi:hypothetical protein
MPTTPGHPMPQVARLDPIEADSAASGGPLLWADDGGELGWRRGW